MTAGWQSFLQKLECTACGGEFDADTLHGVCPTCGKVLFARYDLSAVKKSVTADDFRARRWDMWRYHELLPVRDPANVIALGEGMTPLLRVSTGVSAHLGFERGRLGIKDEGKNPTGSFKARGMSAAISRAKELGVSHVALPSAGNAGSAAAAYAAAGGLTAHVAVPRDVPPVNLVEMQVSGADIILIDGLIDQAGKMIHQRAAEQGGWGENCLPDVIIFPTGGGTGIVGMWKAFEELGTLGWIGPKRPRMVVVQAAGCAPLVRAFEQGAEHAQPWEGAATIAAGIRVPAAIGDYLVLKSIRESGGTALAVSDDEIRAAQLEMAREVGVYASLEGAATWAALKTLRRNTFLAGNEDVVLFNTGMGLKNEAPAIAK